MSSSVGVRFTQEQLDLIDQLRGDKSRAEFVRDLFESALQEYCADVHWPEHDFVSNETRRAFKDAGGLPWIDYEANRNNPSE